MPNYIVNYYISFRIEDVEDEEAARAEADELLNEAIADGITDYIGFEPDVYPD